MKTTVLTGLLMTMQLMMRTEASPQKPVEVANCSSAGSSGPSSLVLHVLGHANTTRPTDDGHSASRQQGGPGGGSDPTDRDRLTAVTAVMTGVNKSVCVAVVHMDELEVAEFAFDVSLPTEVVWPVSVTVCWGSEEKKKDDEAAGRYARCSTATVTGPTTKTAATEPSRRPSVTSSVGQRCPTPPTVLAIGFSAQKDGIEFVTFVDVCDDVDKTASEDDVINMAKQPRRARRLQRRDADASVPEPGDVEEVAAEQLDRDENELTGNGPVVDSSSVTRNDASAVGGYGDSMPEDEASMLENPSSEQDVGQTSYDDADPNNEDAVGRWKRKWAKSGMSWIKRRTDDDDGYEWVRNQAEQPKRRWQKAGMNWIKRSDDKRRWAKAGMGWIKRLSEAEVAQDDEYDTTDWGATAKRRSKWGKSGMSWVKRDEE